MKNISKAKGRAIFDKVYATNRNTGEKECVSKEEYASRDDLTFHTEGMVACKDSDGNSLWVSREEYASRKSTLSFHTEGMVACRDSDNNKLWTSKEEYASKDELSVHTKGMVVCRDAHGDILWLSKDEFAKRSDLLSNIHFNKFRFVDTITDKVVFISKQEAQAANRSYRKYCSDTGIFIIKKRFRQDITPTGVDNSNFVRNPKYHRKRGEVVAYDNQTNDFHVVPKHVFDNDQRYSGTTSNQATVFDPSTNTYIKVSSDDPRIGHWLRGPNVGKKNVIDRTTGIKKQKTYDQLTENDIWVADKRVSKKISPKVSIHFLEWKYQLVDRSLWNLTEQEVIDMQSIIDRCEPLKDRMPAPVKPKTKTDVIIECFKNGMGRIQISQTHPEISMPMISRTVGKLKRELIST